MGHRVLVFPDDDEVGLLGAHQAEEALFQRPARGRAFAGARRTEGPPPVFH